MANQVFQIFTVLTMEKIFVRSGIRTHAQRTGLRPERSALDRSAILTCILYDIKNVYIIQE